MFKQRTEGDLALPGIAMIPAARLSSGPACDISAEVDAGALTPAIRAELLDPEIWHQALEQYALATNLAVALVDEHRQLIGPCLNPQPLWALFRGVRPAGAEACPLCLASPEPCRCLTAALEQAEPVIARSDAGLVHFAVPLLLGGRPLGALLAGQVFDQFPEQLAIEQMSRRFGISPTRAWHVARLMQPIKRQTLEVYAGLLMTFGQTFLQTRYDSRREQRDRQAAEHLQRVSTRLIQHDDIQSLYDEVLDTAAAIMDADFASMHLFFPERCEGQGELLLLGHRGFDPESEESFKWVRAGPGSSCGEALRTGGRVIVRDLETCDFIAGTPRLKDYRRLGCRAVQTTPLVSRSSGAIIGMISTHWREPHTPEETRLRLLDVLARQAGDLIERKQAEEKNAGLYLALQETDRRKDEFLAMLGHELRNPLAPIRSAVEVLRLRCGSDPHLQRLLGIVDRQTAQMGRLVDDLLEVSRIGRNVIELRKERIDFRIIAGHAADATRPVVEAGQHQFTLSLPEEPVWIEGDHARLEQIIDNLLNNAAKYTRPGGRIWLILDQDENWAELRVRDTGRGIPQEKLAIIFELFTQVDTAVDRAAGGLGLGLTLVRDLVALHGGSVVARSEGPGKGAEFIVRLPLAAAGEAQSAEPGPQMPQVTPQRRILIVDDNLDAAETLAEVLELWGHEVRAINDGPAALAEASTYQPEVILMDIGLPGMDGHEVARLLRQRESVRPVALIALTGYGQADDRRRAIQAGFDVHLVKPVDLDQLREVLSHHPD